MASNNSNQWGKQSAISNSLLKKKTQLAPIVKIQLVPIFETQVSIANWNQLSIANWNQFSIANWSQLGKQFVISDSALNKSQLVPIVET
ncbi:MAG: hypothetical protein O7D30_08105 [Rickettsia endosymbiont of Ixodes persulcatus]|nr:hypothetical protein [Rickettsia endosymbiont of Ixodes persulcatus]